MKKILSIALLLSVAIGFVACVNEEDNLFDHSAAERLNAASDLYSSRLMAQPNGWAMQLYPTNQNEYPYGNGYLVLCRFNADHSVVVSMNNEFSNNVYRSDTSLWEVITDNGPVLSFNSHNKCLHAFSDPEDIPFTGTADDAINEQGEGCGGDYEFIIVDAPEDASYMMLKGKKRGTYNLFTPIEVGVDYEAYLTEVKGFMSKMFPSNNPTFDVLTTPNGVYKMTGLDDGIPNIYPYDGDEIIDESFNAFLITKRGEDFYLRFRSGFKYDEEGEKSVQEFKYNPESDIFEGVDDPDCFIDGDNPNRFFHMATLEDGRQWIVTKYSEMSDDFKALVDEMDADFRKLKQRFQNMTLFYQPSNDQFMLRINYGSKINFIYNYSVDEENHITLKYQGPQESGAETVMSRIPAIKSIVEALDGQLDIRGAETRFNLNTVRIVNKNKENFWFFATKN